MVTEAKRVGGVAMSTKVPAEAQVKIKRKTLVDLGRKLGEVADAVDATAKHFLTPSPRHAAQDLKKAAAGLREIGAILRD